jgi:hypothetical protein
MFSEGLGHGATFYIELPIALKKFDNNTNPSPIEDLTQKTMSDRRKIFPVENEFSNVLQCREEIDQEDNAFIRKDSSASSPVQSGNLHKPSWDAGLSFLTVDDSSSYRKMTKKMLCSLGHTVEHAVDGIDFLEKINIRVQARSTNENDIDIETNNNIETIFPRFDVPSL